MANKPYNRVPDAKELIEAVNKKPIVDCFDYVGPTYKTSFEKVAEGMTRFIGDEGQLNELLEIYFVPVINRATGNITWDTECYAIFNPADANNSNAGANIWYRYQRGSHVRTIVDIGRYSGTNGIFGASATFYSTMAKYAIPSSIFEKDGYLRIKIEEYDDDNSERPVALVRLDFMKVIAVALGISSEDYVNMTILSTEQTKNDYIMLLQKYIDTSGTRQSRNRGKANGINMSSIKSGLRYRVRPKQNENGRRGFQ